MFVLALVSGLVGVSLVCVVWLQFALVVSGLWLVGFACSRLWFTCMFVSVGSSLSGLFYGGLLVWVEVDFWWWIVGLYCWCG